MATTPTINEIKSWSKLDFEEQGWDDTALTREVQRAEEYVLGVTGYPGALASIPAEFSQTYQEAIQRRVEQQAFRTNEDLIETAADFDLIKSFGAGSYNETRRDIGDLLKAKVVNPWGLLNDLLMRMMTPDKYDWWLEQWGARAPAFAITEVDWDADEAAVDYYLNDPGA